LEVSSLVESCRLVDISSTYRIRSIVAFEIA
jgi:hypothetical protein